MIIVSLAFALSPYILILGAVLLLVTGVPKLPPFLRPMLPGPLLEVCSAFARNPLSVALHFITPRTSSCKQHSKYDCMRSTVWTK